MWMSGRVIKRYIKYNNIAVSRVQGQAWAECFCARVRWRPRGWEGARVAPIPILLVCVEGAAYSEVRAVRPARLRVRSVIQEHHRESYVRAREQKLQHSLSYWRFTGDLPDYLSLWWASIFAIISWTNLWFCGRFTTHSSQVLFNIVVVINTMILLILSYHCRPLIVTIISCASYPSPLCIVASLHCALCFKYAKQR